MSPAHCVIDSHLASGGYWKIRCACGRIITGRNEALARENYVAHRAEDRETAS
jgi:hypothetical protein